MDSELIPQEIKAHVFRIIQQGTLENLTKQEMAARLDSNYKTILDLMLIQQTDVSQPCKESCSRAGIITVGDFFARKAQSRNDRVAGVVNQKELHKILDHLELIRLVTECHFDEVLGPA